MPKRAAKRKAMGLDQNQGGKDAKPVEIQVNCRVASGGGTVCAVAGTRCFVSSRGPGKEEEWRELRVVTKKKDEHEHEHEDEQKPVVLEDAHSLSVRCCEVSPCGRYVATSGDDKVLRLWSGSGGAVESPTQPTTTTTTTTSTSSSSSSWGLLWSCPLQKRASAVCFTPDSKAVVVADKFGDVWRAEVVRDAESRESGEASCDRIFGHFCSTVTAVGCSGCGTYIATGDRDGKVRVTCLGQTERGGREIQSYCLGHRTYVSGLRFLFAGRELRLATCSGDGQLRLFDPRDGGQVGESVGLETGALVSMTALEEHEGEGDGKAEATLVAVGADRTISLVGAAPSGLLGGGDERRTMRPPTQAFAPTSAARSGGGRLLVVGCEVDTAALGSRGQELGWYREGEGEGEGGEGDGPAASAAAWEAALGSYIGRRGAVYGECGVELAARGSALGGLALVPADLSKSVFSAEQREGRKKKRLDRR